MSAMYFFLRWRLSLGGRLFSLPLPPARVVITPVKYEVTIDEKLSVVCKRLIATLEASNYAIINHLNVQEGLACLGIDTLPIQIIEFCNLTKTYVPHRLPDYEIFAPCRLALFEKEGQTTVRVQRPLHVLPNLSKNMKLSSENMASLKQFDRDLKAVLTDLASENF